jgi:hypothetical protein
MATQQSVKLMTTGQNKFSYNVIDFIIVYGLDKTEILLTKIEIQN